VVHVLDLCKRDQIDRITFVEPFEAGAVRPRLEAR
jgi:hypothetical protein